MAIAAELDSFTFENKMRGVLQELVAPTIRRTIEISEVVDRVQRSDHGNTERLETLEYNMTRVLSRLPLLDEVYKAVQELHSDKQTVENLINLRFEAVMSQLNLNNQQVENLHSLTKANEDSINAVKLDLNQYTESLNGVKDAVLYESGIVVKKLEKTRMQAKEMWDLFSAKIEKISKKVDDFNSIAIPTVNAEAEMIKRKIEDNYLILQQRIDTMLSYDEFEKFGRSLKFEIDKTHTNFKVLAENSDKVQEYLDHYLPIEIWGMVSEGIASVDPKVLEKFVAFDQQKMETLKMDIEFDYLDIEGLSKRALDAYDEGVKRRETLNEAVIESLKKQRQQEKRASKHIKVITKPEKPKGKRELIQKKTFVEDTQPKPEPSKEEKKSSRDSLKETKNIQEIAVIDEEIEETVRSPTTIIPQSTQKELRDISSMPSPTSNNLKPTGSRKSILEIEDTSLYLPPPSRPASRSNFVISPQRVPSESSDNESHSQKYSNFSPQSSPVIDPTKLEHDLEFLRTSLQDLQLKTSSCIETVENNTKTVTSTLDRFSQDLSSNFSLMHGEIKMLLQKNKQNKTDVAKSLQDYQQDLKEREKLIENVVKQSVNIGELVGNLVEFSRVLQLILAQEEEDRENLGLIGFSEGSVKGSHKGYVSLKPECMSCSGSNTVVMSAFKMACVNYNPSPIKYSLKNFTRKQLIQLLGTFINESWRAATARPPYDSAPPPTMSNISLASDSQKRRNRYSRSQYLELPSLNTSKQFLDINDTPLHSFREFKH